MPIGQEIRANLSAWLILAVCSALPVAALWSFLGKTQSLFPPQRRRLAPWSGYEVCLVFFLVLLLLPSLLKELLNRVGFFNGLYGPAFNPVQELGGIRCSLWIAAFAFPLQVAGIVIILRALSGTRLYQLRLTTWGAGRGVVLGWLGWLVLTPPVLALNVLVTWGYWLSEGAPPEEHPLARLAQAQPLAIEWILIVFSSVVVAPILEELLFRGVIQGWSAGRPWGAVLTLAAAFMLSLGNCNEKFKQEQDKGIPVSLATALRDLEPALFVLIVGSSCFLRKDLFRSWLPQPYAARAICSTALLFAAFHIWPTPVPLFLFGLVLGYLACRTQSLVAPIVCHALFNGVACLVMLLLSYSGPVNGKETTSPDCRPVLASSSKIVPGSWLPRRTYASAMGCPSLGETTDEVTRPTSLPMCKSVAPKEAGASPDNFSPTSNRLTWP